MRLITLLFFALAALMAALSSTAAPSGLGNLASILLPAFGALGVISFALSTAGAYGEKRRR